MTQFSAVSSAALDDDRLLGNDILVLAALGYHTDKNGWCWPSQKKLSEKARLTRQSVSDAMRRLVKFGYVERYIPENGDLSKIRYRRILDTARAPDEIVTPDVAPLVTVADKGVGLTDKPLSTEPTRVVAVPDKACRPNRHKQEPSNQSKEQEERANALFEEIWGPWERHRAARKLNRRGDGKAKTREQFLRKATKSDPAVIRSAAFAYIKSVEPEYQQGFSVWLNAEGWDSGNVTSMEPKPATDWPAVLADWLANKGWPANLGPKPHEAGYRGPIEELRPLIAGKNPDHPVIAALIEKLERVAA